MYLVSKSTKLRRRRVLNEKLGILLRTRQSRSLMLTSPCHFSKCLTILSLSSILVTEFLLLTRSSTFESNFLYVIVIPITVRFVFLSAATANNNSFDNDRLRASCIPILLTLSLVPIVPAHPSFYSRLHPISGAGNPKLWEGRQARLPCSTDRSSTPNRPTMSRPHSNHRAKKLPRCRNPNTRTRRNRSVHAPLGSSCRHFGSRSCRLLTRFGSHTTTRQSQRWYRLRLGLRRRYRRREQELGCLPPRWPQGL